MEDEAEDDRVDADDEDDGVDAAEDEGLDADDEEDIISQIFT